MFLKNHLLVKKYQKLKMTLCPTCKLSMESHSTSELMECCMKQVSDGLADNQKGTCPNCKHQIEKHSDKQLAECTLEFLKSNNSN